MIINELTELIIASAIKVHRILGPSFLESVYQAALACEFEKANNTFEKEKALPVVYEDIFLNIGFRCDFLIDNRVIVECKSVKEINPLDHAQLLNYLKITDLNVGLLINFNVRKLTDGIKRIVNNYKEFPPRTQRSLR